jgi:hypothetical protein
MARIQTRMQKSITRNAPASAVAPAASNVTSFQLESGLEECQVKRVVLSAAAEAGIFLVQLAKNDEAFSAPGDFTQDRIIYSIVVTGPILVNETITVRTERGDHYGLLLTASSLNGAAAAAWAECQLNYLVLT